jgi:hypothetical protein
MVSFNKFTQRLLVLPDYDEGQAKACSAEFTNAELPDALKFISDQEFSTEEIIGFALAVGFRRGLKFAYELAEGNVSGKLKRKV